MTEVVSFPKIHTREYKDVQYVIEQTTRTWRWMFSLRDIIGQDMPTRIYGHGKDIIEAEAKCRKRIDTLLDTYQKQREDVSA